MALIGLESGAARPDVARRPRKFLRQFARTAAVAVALLFVPVGIVPMAGVAVVRLAQADELAVTQPGWTISQLKGRAKGRPAGVTSATDWVELESGVTLPPGTEITTGEDGFVTLVSGPDRVQIMANSHVQLPIVEQPGVLTRILHQLGTVFFEVGKRPGRQFEVDTPHLVAIVKGTKFSTQVSDAGDWVTVTEGVVAVSASSSGVSVDVTPGQTAMVSTGSSEDVQVGPTPPGAPSQSPASSASPTAPSSPTDSSSSSGNANQSSGRGEGKGHGNGKGNGKSDEDHGCNGGGNCTGHGKHSPKAHTKAQTTSSPEARHRF